MRAISGGFIVEGQCVGESESLRMKSIGQLDTDLIPSLIDSHEYREPVDIKELAKSKSSVSKNKAKALRKKGISVRGVQ